MIRQKEDRSPKHNRSRQNHRAAERQRAEDGGQTTDYGTANMGQSSASIGVHLRLCCSFLPGAAGARWFQRLRPVLCDPFRVDDPFSRRSPGSTRSYSHSAPPGQGSVKIFVCSVCFVVASGVIVPRSAFPVPRFHVLFFGFLP